ncbi:MAG: hypothetical protein LBK47_01525 [Prevotellaceae bacterium]|jgi:hypothetical protein|nr:hypothetical protein [Prevotellaceae bacterium]
MIKKIFLSIAAAFYFTGISFAQDEVEALRFSRNTHLGTARFSAMGGAFTALGGDVSALAFNPAGIGVYRSNEFTLTGNLLYANTDVSYMGNKMNDYRYRFGLSNFAAVGVYELGQDEGLVSINYGFAYNKTRNFGERYSVLGSYQSANTYLDYFAAVANGEGLGDYEAKMAQDAYLIDTIGSSYGAISYDETQGRQHVETTGGLSTYDFSIGGNVSNVFYFGLSIGIASVSYEENNTSLEHAQDGNVSDFQKFSYYRGYRQNGIGYNFKFGAIVWPFAHADFLTGLKLGGAIHTRTFLSMSDEFTSYIDPWIGGRSYDRATHTPNEFFYEIETPTRLMAGLAYTFSPSTPGGWRGVISADYEYVDYSTITMREEKSDYPADFNEPNASIKDRYRATNNFRLGGELGYQSWAFRLGYAYYDNPYTKNAGKNGIIKDGTINIYSGGLGLQVNEMFNLSFTYSLSAQKDKGYMYYYKNVTSDIKNYAVHQNNFFLTLGWRF